MSTFNPPSFKDFAKQQKDLFKKKYDFDNSIKMINKNGSLSFEAGAVGTKCGAYRGYVKASGAKCPVTGSALELELHTSANQESKFSYKKRFDNGLVSTFGLSSKDKAFKKTSGSVAFDYSREFFSATGTVKSDLENHRLETQASFGKDGLSLGGSADFDLSNSPQLTEANYGVNYANKDYNTAIYTESNRDVIVGSYYLNVSATQQVGAAVKYDLGKDTRTWTFGSDVKVNNDTTARLKAELSNANSSAVNVSTAVESRLNSLLFSVASSFKVSHSAAEATSVGVGVTFGDF